MHYCPEKLGLSKLWFLYESNFFISISYYKNDRRKFLELNTFKLETRRYLPRAWSDKGLKGTVVNWPFLNSRSSKNYYGSALHIIQNINIYPWKQMFFLEEDIADLVEEEIIKKVRLAFVSASIKDRHRVSIKLQA